MYRVSIEINYELKYVFLPPGFLLKCATTTRCLQLSRTQGHQSDFFPGFLRARIKNEGKSCTSHLTERVPKTNPI